MLVSEAPCAQAITLMPFRPSVPNSFPAMPGVCFMFSPTIATVARFFSAWIGEISPISISLANSSFSTSQARSASALRTPIEVLFSDEACETRNTTDSILCQRLKEAVVDTDHATIPKPCTVIRLVSLMDEIPLMALLFVWSTCCLITVPWASGLKVFLIRIGMFL